MDALSAEMRGCCAELNGLNMEWKLQSKSDELKKEWKIGHNAGQYDTLIRWHNAEHYNTLIRWYIEG